MGLAVAAARADEPPAAPPAPASAPAPSGPAPRVVFEQKEIDFGKVVLGAVVERTFKFKNAGTAALAIRRVKPSCGCTAALLSKPELGPGEAGEISVRFETGDRQGFQSIEVAVFSNDAQEKDNGEHVSVLRLRGEIANLLNVMPMSFYYPSFLRGAPTERRVTVLANDVAEVKALSVEASQPWLKPALRPFERQGKKGFEVVLEIAPDVPLGRIEERVLVKTDHAKQPTLRIPVVGAVHGKILAFPERIEVVAATVPGMAVMEKEPQIHIMRVAGEGGLAIDAIEVPPQLFVEVVEVVPGRRVEVNVKVVPDAPRGPFAGVVRVFVRDAEQPVFTIPVTGEIRPTVTVDPAAAWLEAPKAASAVIRVGGGQVVSAKVAGAPVVVAVEEGGLVKLSILPDAPPGPFRGTLKLKTDVPGETDVEVPVRGLVPPK